MKLTEFIALSAVMRVGPGPDKLPDLGKLCVVRTRASMTYWAARRSADNGVLSWEIPRFAASG